jgi:hypothetical protein
MAMITESDISKSLAATYIAYRNGGRDREKLTREQLATAFILESELLLTAVYYFADKLSNLEPGTQVDFVTSPAAIVDSVDFGEIAEIINVFLKSRVRDANTAINVLDNGAE